MSKSHSGDAWMKLIGIGEHNVKKTKGKVKEPQNLNGCVKFFNYLSCFNNLKLAVSVKCCNKLL